MVQASHGDTVKVHYTGKLEDGTEFDSSIHREPLQLTIGQNQIIPGFEQAVVGMKPDESKIVKIPAEKAYGLHQPDKVMVVERNRLPPSLNLELGQQLEIRQANNRTAVVTVIDITESSVTLDANHPLAGKELIFDIQLLAII